MERYENWIRSELNQAKGSKPSDSKRKVEQEVKSDRSGKEVSVPSGVPLTRQGALEAFEGSDWTSR